MNYYYQKTPSPVGELTLIANDKSLVTILWENDKPNRVRLPKLEAVTAHPVLLATKQQLGEYFAGTRNQFELPLEFDGSEFQVKVWHALRQIPYGQTRSYRDLAIQIGSPKAYRAVGMANRCNPISIIVPCHRVIGSNGKLTGFAGGLEAKAFLLELEKKPSK